MIRRDRGLERAGSRGRRWGDGTCGYTANSRRLLLYNNNELLFWQCSSPSGKATYMTILQFSFSSGGSYETYEVYADGAPIGRLCQS